MQSASFVDSSVRTPRPTVEQLQLRVLPLLTWGMPRAAAAAVTKAAAARTAWYDQRCTYRQLRRSKCSDYWRNKVEANESDPRQLWRLVDELLGRGRVPASSAIDVETFNQFCLLIKLPGSEPLPAMRHHRRLVVFDLARLSVASHR